MSAHYGIKPHQHIVVTGGTGFIGSHTCLALLEAECRVTIMDNLSNSFMEAFSRMKELAGDKADLMTFHDLDLLDEPGLDKLFGASKVDAVIHFAGLKAVGESVHKPLWYYKNNVAGTCNLMEAMKKHGCKTMVFSSSCTVYGEPQYVPLDEKHSLNAISPYGRTKLFIEEIMRDESASDPEWNIVLLRYFNPVGAHPSGRIGEHPIGIPNNLMPYVQQVAVGIREKLSVFGNDYDTRDGTCVRDYIHVMDLADAHVAAVAKATAGPGYGCKPINVGTGTGTTVLEMVAAFEKASGKAIPYSMAARREGDTVAVWAATETVESELGWKAKLGIDEMCRDQWKWASENPKGYES